MTYMRFYVTYVVPLPNYTSPCAFRVPLHLPVGQNFLRLGKFVISSEPWTWNDQTIGTTRSEKTILDFWLLCSGNTRVPRVVFVFFPRVSPQSASEGPLRPEKVVDILSMNPVRVHG